jgi:hypothetical protein
VYAWGNETCTHINAMHVGEAVVSMLLLLMLLPLPHTPPQYHYLSSSLASHGGGGCTRVLRQRELTDMQKRAPIVLDLRDRRTDARCCADDGDGGAHVLSMEVEQVAAALRRLDASCHARVVQSLASDVAKRAGSQLRASGASAASHTPPPPLSTPHTSAARASPATPSVTAASSTPMCAASSPKASRGTAVVAKPEPSAPTPVVPADYDLNELD